MIQHKKDKPHEIFENATRKKRNAFCREKENYDFASSPRMVINCMVVVYVPPPILLFLFNCWTIYAEKHSIGPIFCNRSKMSDAFQRNFWHYHKSSCEIPPRWVFCGASISYATGGVKPFHCVKCSRRNIDRYGFPAIDRISFKILQGFCWMISHCLLKWR